jgi:diguanylate cyclase (GGDEF)-like protein
MLVLIAAFIAFFAYKTKRSQLHFMKLSRQDGLTGVANRPHFIELAEAALTNSKKMQQEICVVLCDLDHFKVINDEYGHAAGDAALKQVVAACRGQLRANDVFGRVGGEEFGILLPACSLEAARERCEQLRLALAELVVTHEDNTITVSGSFGVESTASSGYVLRQLLANADAALYQAKRAGRNRVVVYDVSVIDAFASMTQTGRLRASTERFNVDLTPQRE